VTRRASSAIAKLGAVSLGLVVVASPALAQDLPSLAEIEARLDEACQTSALVEAAGELDLIGEMYLCLGAVNDTIAVAAELAERDPAAEARQVEIGMTLCLVGMTQPTIGFDLVEKVLASGNELLQDGCSAVLDP